MQAEREELVKFTFPQIRELCESRGVVFSDVDLRWGITEEQKAEGHVLGICLDEIRSCRPYFLGLLGERYGWVPEELTERLLDDQPWLKAHAGRSVTELEIFHGVLRDTSMAEHAFFYFRDPNYSKVRPSFEEHVNPDELKRLGADEAQRRAESRRLRLVELKEEIRRSGRPVREDYPDPRALGELALADLTSVVNRLFPEELVPSPPDRDRAMHEAFAANRARIYIPRQEDFDALDRFAGGAGPPLVVLGESGVGKSALLANWARHFREGQDRSRSDNEHPAVPVIMHFVSAAPAAADWSQMLRRLLSELDALFELDLEIPIDPAALRSSFAKALYQTAARGRVVIVIDALNQLDDKDGALDLAWLPPVVPENIRLLLSTLPGRALEAAGSRGWQSLEVRPLDLPERRKLVASYLSEYAKTLDEENTSRIVGAPQAANPLFLRAVLEELRVFGRHEQLTSTISDLLAEKDPESLYRLILSRYQKDYERDRPGLVEDTMSILWAARYGLTEKELLDLVGTEEGPLPQALWAPLHRAAKEMLVDHGGVLTFAYEYVRSAVKAKFVAGDRARERHLQIAHYFSSQEQPTQRKLQELPWQYQEAESWLEQHQLLGDVIFMMALDDVAPFELRAYWTALETNSPYDMRSAYAGILAEPSKRGGMTVDRVAHLFLDTGRPAEADTLWQANTARYREIGNLDGLQKTLSNRGIVLRHTGDLDGAMDLYQEQERICRQLSDLAGLQLSLGNQGIVFWTRGDLDDAMDLYKEQERICRQISDRQALAASLGNQGNVLADKGDHAGALALYREQERLCRELSDLNGLQVSYGNQGLMLWRQADLAGASHLYSEQERICRRIGDISTLAVLLGNQAIIQKDLGDLRGAITLHQEEQRICRQLGDSEALQRSLGNQAVVLMAQGDLAGAMNLLLEKEEICRRLGLLKSLQMCLLNEATVLEARGDLDGALIRLQEEEQLCRRIGNEESAHFSIQSQHRLRELQRLRTEKSRAEGIELSQENHVKPNERTYLKVKSWLQDIYSDAVKADDKGLHLFVKVRQVTVAVAIGQYSSGTTYVDLQTTPIGNRVVPTEAYEVLLKLNKNFPFAQLGLARGVLTAEQFLLDSGDGLTKSQLVESIELMAMATPDIAKTINDKFPPV